jgi:mRNA interferase MazF
VHQLAQPIGGSSILLQGEQRFELSPVVVPLTTKTVDDAEPLRLRIPASGRLRRDSDLLIDQIRVIDNRRLVSGPMTRLPSRLVSRVGAAIREVLDLA